MRVKERDIRNSLNDLKISRLLIAMLTLVVLTSMIILPNSNWDPISVPKFSIFSSSLAVILAYVALKYSISMHSIKSSIYLNSLIIFVLLISVNLLINNYALEERLFGVSGRNTGMLLYLGFALLAFTLAFLPSRLAPFYIAIALTIANIGVCTYFLIQLSGRDFFNYTEYYGAPSSTLGNPNFVSGFVGFAAIAAWLFVIKRINWINIVLAIMSTAISIFVILKSQSVQGLFSLLGGLSIVLMILVSRKSRKMALGLAITTVAGGSLSFLGFLGFGPLGERLVTTTLLSRFDYWRAALAMTMDAPLFGKGLDSFGDYYRAYRDEAAFNRFGESQVADSAHSVFLDLFSGGGIPLGVCYILIQAIPAAILVKKLLSSNGFNGQELILLGIWVAFTLQSAISINQIGVGIWGWALSGLIYGQVRGLPLAKAQRSPLRGVFNISSVLVALSIMLYLYVAPMRSDSIFLSSANSTDGIKLKEVSLRWPMDTKRVLLTSQGFKNAGYEQLSLEISIAGVEHNPYSYTLWKQIYENSKASSQLRLEAEGNLMKIEPRFVRSP